MAYMPSVSSDFRLESLRERCVSGEVHTAHHSPLSRLSEIVGPQSLHTNFIRFQGLPYDSPDYRGDKMTGTYQYHHYNAGNVRMK
jgi:hypothetical protein